MKVDLTGHNGRMSEVPPVVRCQAIDGPAYLIGWARRADGTWWARLAWVIKIENDYRGSEDWFSANDVEPMTGQDYSQVPRRSDVDPGGLGGSPGRRRHSPPMDPTDPRDPAHDSRTLDRALIENNLRRDEPDF